ncbi:MAG TPA: DUF3618 domain-containing protein [Gemmatimonadaceae bacterium]
MSGPQEFRRVTNGEPGSGASPAAIRAEIVKTRERLGDNVEALGAQLNPSHLKQRVKDSVREATIGRVQHMASNTKDRIAETGRSLAQTIRDNPLPAAMAAAGIGWLLLSGRDQPARSTRYLDGAPDEFGMADSPDSDGGVRAKVRDAAETVADKAHDIGDRAQEATQHAMQRTKEAGERVAQRARETGERVAHRADRTMQRVREGARSATHRVETQYEDSPIGMGAVALAVGLAVGLSVPSTHREAELMGDARDKLVDKTRETIADTTDKVERVVDRALPEVKNAIREASREVRDEVRAAARDEGLTT